jgi:hypothetical protein
MSTLQAKQILKLKSLVAKGTALYQLHKSTTFLKGSYDNEDGICVVVLPMKCDNDNNYYDMIGEKLTCDMDFPEDGIAVSMSGDAKEHYEYVTSEWVIYPLIAELGLVKRVDEDGRLHIDIPKLDAIPRFMTGELNLQNFKGKTVAFCQASGLSILETDLALTA